MDSKKPLKILGIEFPSMFPNDPTKGISEISLAQLSQSLTSDFSPFINLIK